jgi:hypothetical protein
MLYLDYIEIGCINNSSELWQDVEKVALFAHLLIFLNSADRTEHIWQTNHQQKVKAVYMEERANQKNKDKYTIFYST